MSARPTQFWDAIIVGAGPAGTAAAYALAAGGAQVLLLAKSSFPRPKACAAGLTAKAIHALRYPIDPVVRRTLHSIDLEHEQALTVSRRAPVCVMTVRSELDAFCLQQAVARGAAFRRIGTLAALEETPDHVTVTLDDSEQLSARVVLGADGVHSRVRSLLGPA